LQFNDLILRALIISHQYATGPLRRNYYCKAFSLPGSSLVSQLIIVPQATQWTLIFIATGVIVARLYLRLILQKRRLLISDLFMCAGWCSAVALASFDIVFYRMGILRQGVTLGLVGFEGTSEEAERFYKVAPPGEL
jgi:hypothetical protein